MAPEFFTPKLRRYYHWQSNDVKGFHLTSISPSASLSHKLKI
jgi:hypothetical protein